MDYPMLTTVTLLLVVGFCIRAVSRTAFIEAQAKQNVKGAVIMDALAELGLTVQFSSLFVLGTAIYETLVKLSK